MTDQEETNGEPTTSDVLSSLLRRVGELEGEVRQLRDEAEIRRLILSYGPLVDSVADGTGALSVASQWMPDGEYDVDGAGTKCGQSEIAALYLGEHLDHVADGIAHVMGAPVIDHSGDSADVFGYSCVFRVRHGSFHAWRVSVNEWRVIRTPAGWRISKRVNRLVGRTTEVPDVVQRAAARAGALLGNRGHVRGER